MISLSHWGMFDMPANCPTAERLKSLAHPEWPYQGTAHAWPVKSQQDETAYLLASPVNADRLLKSIAEASEQAHPFYAAACLQATYQRLSFGREMP